MRNVPGTGIYFFSLEFLKKEFRQIYGAGEIKYSNFAIGAIARAFAGFVLMPATVIKVRREVKRVYF